MSRVPSYRVEEYSYQSYTEEGSRKFGQWLSNQDWLERRTQTSVDGKVSCLHDVFSKGMEHPLNGRLDAKKNRVSPSGWRTHCVISYGKEEDYSDALGGEVAGCHSRREFQLLYRKESRRVTRTYSRASSRILTEGTSTKRSSGC